MGDIGIWRRYNCPVTQNKEIPNWRATGILGQRGTIYEDQNKEFTNISIIAYNSRVVASALWE